MTSHLTLAARACAAFLLFVGLAACGGAPATDTASSEPGATPDTAASEPGATAAATEVTTLDGNLTDDCVEDFSADADYFPDKTEFEHAKNVSVTYEKSYKVVEVTTLEGEEPQRYVLLQCGAEPPPLEGDLSEAQVIDVPIKSAITLTTTNLPHFVELDAAETVVGVGTAAFVASPEILERVESKDVSDYASAEGQPNQEKIIGAQPELLVMDAFGETIVEDANRFAEAGVPTVLNADFNEQELLGRAEWLKFTALFLNAEAAATDVFDEIATEYDRVVAAAAEAKDQPTVFANTPFEGTWFMPGGNSFFANAVRDANGKYVFGGDSSTFSLELDIETVLDKAGDADIWLQAGSVQGTLGDLAKADERFSKFAAFRKGQVWASDKSLSPGGGNAFFEDAYTRADIVISDLVKILHPDVLPDHELVYFGQVKRGGKN